MTRKQKRAALQTPFMILASPFLLIGFAIMWIEDEIERRWLG
jgi:hypothetical protein